MAQGYLVPLPNRVWNTLGTAPGNGFLIYTYEPGGTTPLTTYSNATLLSANTNPIEADADGYFRMFVAAGTLVKIEVHDADDSLLYTLDNLEPMVDPSAPDPSVTAVPTGGIVAYGAASAPTGFLLCDGTLVPRATYDDLFAVIGTSFGAGDGSTTFGLPDLRGRFPLGTAASGTGSTLGGTGGAIDHTHTGPSHTHVVTVPRDNWGNSLNIPQVTDRLTTGNSSGTGADVSGYQATADQDVTSAAGGTGNTGTANPPFQSVVYIIKT